MNGKTYVVDCGRGAVSQYLRAGLSMPSLSGIFLTHLHADHTVDYFSFPLLAGGASGDRGFHEPIGVYGPGPSGQESMVAGAPGPVPGTVEMTGLANQAFAAHTTFFLSEHFGVDPAAMVDVHDVMPPAATGASLTDTAPEMQPFTVMEDENVRVTRRPRPARRGLPGVRLPVRHRPRQRRVLRRHRPHSNMTRLAHRADVLVHEAAALDALPGLGLRPALLEHIRAVHTDVDDLGEIAAEAEVGSLVVSHLSPGNPRAISDESGRP